MSSELPSIVLQEIKAKAEHVLPTLTELRGEILMLQGQRDRVQQEMPPLFNEQLRELRKSLEKLEQTQEGQQLLLDALQGIAQGTEFFTDAESTGLKLKQPSRISLLRAKIAERVADKFSGLADRLRPSFFGGLKIKHSVETGTNQAGGMSSEVINNSQPPDSLVDLVYDIAKNGQLPYSSTVTFHEAIHVKQLQDMQTAYGLRFHTIQNIVLNEALARRIADFPSGLVGKDTSFLRQVMPSSGYKGEANKSYLAETAQKSDEIEAEWKLSFQIIDFYKGLGLSVGEISSYFQQIIKTARQTDKKKPLVTICAEAMQLALGRQTADQDEQIVYRDLMIQRGELRDQIHRLRAQKMLREAFVAK